MRGGITYINKRQSKGNNEYCSDYDSEKTKTYITYLDMNDLYGYAMSQYLPYANFKWFNNVKLIMYSSTGYMLEVDLQYPKELH